MDLCFNLKLKFQFKFLRIVRNNDILQQPLALSSSRHVRQIEHKVYHLVLASCVLRESTCDIDLVTNWITNNS